MIFKYSKLILGNQGSTIKSDVVLWPTITSKIQNPTFAKTVCECKIRCHVKFLRWRISAVMK